MKTCFKCNQEKPLTEFYKHPKMGDGYLGKCKECNKDDSKIRYQEKMEDSIWREKERLRQRTKERVKRHGENIVLEKSLGQITKRAANVILGNAVRDGRILKKVCQICGETKSQGHHEDYAKPLDVFWLCARHHNDRHIHLRYCKLLKIEPLDISSFFKDLIQLQQEKLSR